MSPDSYFISLIATSLAVPPPVLVYSAVLVTFFEKVSILAVFEILIDCVWSSECITRALYLITSFVASGNV